jgi:hypothetical protein
LSSEAATILREGSRVQRELENTDASMHLP